MDTSGGKALQERLNDEHVVNALNRILDRLDVIEGALEKMHEAPGMVAMMTDIVDDTVNTASAHGVDIDERLRLALQVAEKFTRPGVVERVDGLLNLAEEAPSMISMTVDIMDDTVRQAEKNGVSLDERLRMALELAEKMTQPKVVDQMSKMLDMMQESSGLMAVMVDSLDDIMAAAIERGVDPQEFAKQAIGVTGKMAEIMSSEEMKEMLEGGMFDKKTIKILSAASGALAEANSTTPPKVGLFGLMRALKNPDMQKAMGFLTSFARFFGKRLG